MKKQEEGIVNKKAKQLSEVVYYFTKKIYEIEQKTGLNISITTSSKKISWKVENENFDTIKKGTFKQCMDFVLDKWKKS